MTKHEFFASLNEHTMYKVNNSSRYTYVLPANMTSSDIDELYSRYRNIGSESLFEDTKDFNSILLT